MNSVFGKVLNIEDDKITFENLTKVANLSYMNMHVAILEAEKTVIGEIINITEQIITILLIGTIKGTSFKTGVIKKPTNLASIRFITKEELEVMIGSQQTNLNEIEVGKSSIYKQFVVNARLNEFLGNHFAIIGNSGSGKSCGAARLIQNLLTQKLGQIPEDAHIVMIDAYGEYNNAFSKVSDTIGLNVKSYTTKIGDQTTPLINIPAYLLDIDDLALLLGVTNPSQLQILEKARKLVYLFKNSTDTSSEYKTSIIASCILDILTSGRNSTQIRDQVVAVLSNYNTEVLNLDSEIKEPGYNRTIKQCLNIDDQGKINSLPQVIKYIQQFIKIKFEDIKLNMNTIYTLDDYYYALEFALISEGSINSQEFYEANNILKNQLLNIINSDKKQYFSVSSYMTRDQYVEKFFTKDSEKCQLVNLNISYIDDRLAKTLTKIFAKLFFLHTVSLTERGTYPIHIIVEEAHRYIQNDNDTNIIGYNIFDRICKEGRKYGTILGLITQRPSELSTTVISQCSNFIIFKIFHPDDLVIIRNISTNINANNFEKIKSLEPGSALLFGTAFPLASIVKFDLPDPMPSSESVKINDIWYK